MSHPFLPLTDEDRQQMLRHIGVESIEEILEAIPEQLRLREPLPLPPQLSEAQTYELLRELAARNAGAHTHICFMGAGAYDHYVPAVVKALISRGEFQTAYTPYQAEVAQGTLQSIYEFQSMLCGYRARIRNHGHSCFLCEIVIRSQFHTTYEPEA